MFPKLLASKNYSSLGEKVPYSQNAHRYTPAICAGLKALLCTQYASITLMGLGIGKQEVAFSKMCSGSKLKQFLTGEACSTCTAVRVWSVVCGLCVIRKSVNGV